MSRAPIKGAASGVVLRSWLHGPARYDGRRWIELDAERARPYGPVVLPTLAFDFAHLAWGGPDEVVAFVQRYGLPWRGRGRYPNRVALDEVVAEAHIVAAVLTGHSLLRRAAAADVTVTPEIDDAVTRLGKVAEHYRNELPRVDSASERLAQVLAGLVSIRLRDSNALTGLASAIGSTSWGESSPDAFVITTDPDDLIGHVYLQLAEMFVARRNLRACEQDGRFFPVRDARQRFCSKECGSRSRQEGRARRTRERQTHDDAGAE